MATTLGNRDERELNPTGDAGRHEQAHPDRPARVSDAQLRAAAKVLDSYLQRAQEGAQHAGQ